ncbi:MAG: hypothetical protein JWQ50_597 [Caballeronia mineralivorans]|jgi:hypothetical protein|nr:hypothetical protein [Caballeronia mineralivorans]MEA3097456.1 hypothetical protein [Caballeronia mineralivorans]
MSSPFDIIEPRALFGAVGSKPYGICMAFCHNGLPDWPTLAYPIDPPDDGK